MFRQDQPHVRPIKLDVTIKEALTLLRATLPTTIDIQHHFEAQDPTVLADPIQMHQVLMNLCANAGHAMRDTGGTLKIHLDEVNLTSGSTHGHPPGGSGMYVRLRVKDSGHGMALEVQNRLFDPFSRQKRSEKGLGSAFRWCMKS